ncbi:MAG TPA: GNAT family N-acetyltransferase [Streptosporangiaceae bacterium]|nr:GNAT family N-acetyltransferase [Streptosporangiaceae bacterium]
MIVRDAQPGELAEVGEIRVAAYVADGFMSPDSGYAPTLRALGGDGDGDVLVATDESGDESGDVGDGRILGTVTLQFWPHGGEIGVGRDEAEIRALAVIPGEQGRGTGTALLNAVIELARQAGVRRLLLLTQQEMKTAQRMYERAGFVRMPDRDWSPAEGVVLLAYGMPLAPSEP